MKLEWTEEEILNAMNITEQVKEKATEITIKWIEIVEEQKTNGVPYVNEVEFNGESFQARNDLDYMYDYKGMDDLTVFTFPTAWLFLEEEKLVQELVERKQLIEKNKQESGLEKQRKRLEEEIRLEVEQLKKLNKKHPNILKEN